MFLLNKTRRNSSREPSSEDCTETEDSDYMYAGSPERPPPSRGQERPSRDRKQSRMRVSFFNNGRRRSLDVPADGHLDNPRSPSARTFTEGADDASDSIYSRRRRLRKISSKSSLASIASFSTSSLANSPHEGKTKSRFSETLLRANPWAPTPQQINLTRPKISITLAKQSISGPYNFTHITQVNPLDAARLHHGQNLGEEWNRALHRESQSRPGTAQTCLPTHIRNDSVATFETHRSQGRSRSNSTKSLSRPESHVDPVPTSPEPVPATPPLRSSRLCLRIAEHPEEEIPAQPLGNGCDDIEEGIAPDETPSVKNTVSSLEDCCFGPKPTGSDQDGDSELHSRVPAIRETQSTPDLAETSRGEEEDTVYMPQMYLSVRPRPMSQLSHASDTLSGAFHVPPSPPVGHGSRRSRRISQRLSTHLRLHGSFPADGADIDSWEQDIDWCYENEAEDFDWQNEVGNVEICAADQDEGLEIIQPLSPRPRSPQPVLLEPSVTPTELHGIPEEPKDEPVAERRITGIFEDRLLLPPSPRFAPSSFGFPGSQRARDSGFESTHSNDESYPSRAGSTATRHRSISMSPSLPDLAPGRPYREELCRVAKQLDEHIAALNAECYYPASTHSLSTLPLSTLPPSTLPPSTVPPSTLPLSTYPKRTSSLTEDTKPFSGTRSRADSQTTCVTLCSDTDTITPIETHEIVTPSSSAHNSFQFSKQRAASVTGAGYAVEGRLEKGLSFPAAAIPGVVEVGPDSLHGVPPEEAEFVHYI